MQRLGFPIAGSIIFAGGLALGLAALGGNINLPEQNIVSRAALPFEARAETHETWADSQTVLQFPNASEITAEIETVSSAPPTRSSFMASWDNVPGATGYLLDVSTSDSFSDYVDGYHDLDVGNVIGRVATGLNPGTTYYYRVRPYTTTGPGSYSEATTATTVPTTGLIIHATFDSSITGNPNAAAIEAMINRAISIYESLFRDPITIQIRFRYATTAPDGTPLPAGLLSQSDSVFYTVPWSTFINALRADATTSNDNLANASLPGTALSPNIGPHSANGRAVGLDTPPAMFANGTVGPGGPYDGIVTLNSSRPFQFTRPTSANKFDAQRSTEHEINEVMGFASHANISNLRAQDLFSWSSAGHRNISSSGTRYFSINGGVINIVNFNQSQMYDFGDWLSAACPQAHPYVQNAFGCMGQSSDVTATSPEAINLDVIGYDLVNAVVTTNAATNITSSSATLNGTVNPNGLTTSVHFQYGTTTSYGSTTANQTFTGNTTRNVAANISGLSASTTYHFRIVATNGGGTRFGSDRTFTTLTATGPPVVTTNPATNVTSSAATLNGSLDPHGLTTTVYFQYGRTTNYGSTTPMQNETGNTYRDIASNIAGLTAHATYHFRIVATNSGGTRVGSDRTLSTLPLPPDESVAWQNNTLHDGFDPASPLVPPLRLKWSRDLSANGVNSISYPLITGGRVFVTTTGPADALMALDARTGATIWSVYVAGGYEFVNATYDSGKVFVLNSRGLMKAFDAANGTLLWSVPVASYQFFTSAPTAANGTVFTGGGGGTVYAVNETNGAVLWLMPVEGGEDSSPAVTQGKVFVSYVGPQAYAFNAANGQQVWHYSGGGEGGGGTTPVVHAGKVYVRISSSAQSVQTNGFVLDANTGNLIGGFSSDGPPAFIGYLGLFLENGTLHGVDSRNGQVLWSFAGDGGLTSAPVVVNQTIYIGSSSGTFYGLTTNGQQIWSTNVGAAIPIPGEGRATMTTGLGAGDGLLIVPTASTLVAYGN